MKIQTIIVALLVVVNGAPNHLKHVSVDKQVIVNGGGNGGNLGASASWGPFSAGAGINGGAAGASADYPGAGASAGIGGSSSASATASASAGSHPGVAPVTGSGGTIFDQIFNIPISVLKTVNEHLNNKETVPGAQRRLRKCRRRGICNENEEVHVSHASSGAGAQTVAGDNGANAQASAQADANAHVHSRQADTASAGAPTGAATVAVRKNYDSVFAIPISALTSVNQLLNGKK